MSIFIEHVQAEIFICLKSKKENETKETNSLKKPHTEENPLIFYNHIPYGFFCDKILSFIFITALNQNKQVSKQASKETHFLFFNFLSFSFIHSFLYIREFLLYHKNHQKGSPSFSFSILSTYELHIFCV